MSSPSRTNPPLQLTPIFSRRITLAVLAVLAFSPGLLQAQEAGAPAHVTVRGQVVDRAGGQAIPGAMVHIPGLRHGTLTGEDGHFTLHRVPVGEREVVVQRIGYVERTVTWNVGSGMGDQRVQMEVDPVVMEGFTVTIDRLQRRRNAFAYSTRVIDERQVRFSSAPNMLELVRLHGAATLVPCGGGSFSWCVRSRGSVVRTAVIIDEAPSFPEMLEVMQPYEVHSVELVRGGRVIRVYTHQFIERLARNPRILGSFLPL